MPKQGLANIGIDIKVGASKDKLTALNYVTSIGDIGGAPSELDATCLKDKIKKSVPGVQDTSSWECEYLFDNTDENSDYRVLKALQDAGAVAHVQVLFPDGTGFETSGYVSTMINGVGVDELIKAKFTVSLQSEWAVTNPGDETAQNAE